MPLLRTTSQLLFFVLIEIYFFYGINKYLRNKIVKISYFSLSLLCALVIIGAAFKPFILWPRWLGVYLVGGTLVVLFSKLFGCLFLLVGDIKRAFVWLFKKFFKNSRNPRGRGITRGEFFNQLAAYGAVIPFVGLIYGMIKTVFEYKVHRIKLTFPNLPKSFDGLRIVQISDIHCGTYVNQGPLDEAIKIIQSQEPDIIFFTGDLVNEIALEAYPYEELLKKVKAPLGVFSVLGNHDYGDYFKWDKKEDKIRNLKDLKSFHRRCGWDLLLNENRILERDGERIAIIGVENWGKASRFPKLGDVSKAKEGTEEIPFKILLSHDPSHWEAKVLGKHPDIDLTLSGHTHGMQLGVEIKGFKWSPSKFFYPQWAGLYQNQSQYLYVNRGLGVIGYPGRIGIHPEITVVELFAG